MKLSYWSKSVGGCVSSVGSSSSSLSDDSDVESELDPSPAIMISPMSAFKGARSNVGTGAGNAVDKVKRSSKVLDFEPVCRPAQVKLAKWAWLIILYNNITD